MTRTTVKPRRLAFLDQHGALTGTAPSGANLVDLRLAPGADEGVRLLHAAGYHIVVTGNQAGVALGEFPESALLPLARRLRELLKAVGVPLTGFGYCPHHPAGIVEPYTRVCTCRKPAPGLLVGAAEALGADARRCWAVGDDLDDVEAGRRAGCRTVLVVAGPEPEREPRPWRRPHHVAPDLATAARLIVADDVRRASDARFGRRLPEERDPSPRRARGRAPVDSLRATD